jgi:DNA-binding transcriptional ArsR family regulator
LNIKKLEKVFKAFANRRRLMIVRHLKICDEASVTMIAEEIGLSLKATSRHLVLLAGADVLEKEQRGLVVFYRLSQNPNSPACDILPLI